MNRPGRSEDAAASRHGALASPTPPAGAASDWTIPQNWQDFTAEDHWIWETLYARQQRLLRGRAVAAFHQGLETLGLSGTGIPDFEDLNRRLHARTGWTVVAVPGLVPDDVFFSHLKDRRFPAGNFIRRANQLDYLEEPDVFHDVFGHVPLLAYPPVAEFMQMLGKLGLEALDCGALHRLARLYWYTVEFGLCREDGANRICGAGILSSSGESIHAWESAHPRRVGFELRRVLRTRYVTDVLQETYFVIDGFPALQELVAASDFPALYRELDAVADLDPGPVALDDRLAA